MRIHTLAAMLLGLMAGVASAPAIAADMPHTLSWNEIEKMPLPAPGEKIAYGSAPQQFGELRLPPGAGPFPVVMLVHGGCWLSEFDYVHITRLAAALVEQAGVATWTIEYRRLGDAGGGWPNTLLDPARAADHLRELAKKYPLDLQRVVSAGHSAGGQLALWLAARGKLPTDSALYLKDPLKLKGAIGLAAITDLETYRVGPPDSCNASVDQLIGGTPAQYSQRFAQASPMALLPLGVPQWLIQGGQDRIVPTTSASAYAQAAAAKGDLVHLQMLPSAGHFEMVAPQPPALTALVAAVKAAVGP